MSQNTRVRESTTSSPNGDTFPASGADLRPRDARERAPAQAGWRAFNAFVTWLSGNADKTSATHRYGLAIALALLGVVSAFVFHAANIEVGLLTIPILAIVVATFVSGIRAGLIAAALTIATIEVAVLEPAWGLDLDAEEIIGLLSFAGAALIGGALSLAMRESRDRAVKLADQRRKLLGVVIDNERHLRNLADAMPVLIARATPDGSVDYFNRTMLAYAGKTEEHLVRESMRSVIHPDDFPGAMASFERSLRTGEQEVLEQRLLRADGQYRWHLSFGSAVRDASGRVTEWVGAYVDIHDRKVAQEALAASEDRHRTLADSMEAMVCTASTDSGPLDFFNRRFYEYTGLTPETLSNRPMVDVLHPDDYDDALSVWNDARREGRSFSAEHRLRRHDGAYRWHFTRGTPIPNAAPGGPRWMLTVIDIHDRKIAEDRIAASEDRYRTLADSMDAIVCMSSREDGVIDFFNRQFFEYTGTDPDAMPDPPILRAVMHPDDFARGAREWIAARKTGTPYQGEYRFRRHDGQYRWHIGRANPMPTPEGQPTAWVFALVDIDDQKRLEHALRASETRYRTLIAAAPVFVYNADAAGKVTFASQSFYEYTGMHPEGDDVTVVIAKALHPDDLQPVRDRWQQAVETGQQFEMEARVLGADGRYRWHLSRLVAEVEPATGQVTGWVGTSTNIDDRKRAEDALRASREHYRALSDTVPALVFTNAQNGTFLFGNRHYYEYTGLTPERALKWDEHGVLHPDDLSRIHEVSIESLQRGESVQVEVRLLRHDGVYRWHLASSMPLFDANGAPDGWITVNVDIHERKVQEERERLLSDARALLASSLDYQEVLDSLAQLLSSRVAEWAAIHVREDDGTIRRVALSYTNPEMKPYAESGNVIDPEGTAGIARVLRTGEPELIGRPTEEDYSTIRADARDLARAAGFQSSMILPLTYQGRTRGVLAINSCQPHRFSSDDLSAGVELARQAAVALEHARLYRALQETAESLREANAAKDEFLGLVSHELKTPITTILGNAEVLHRRGKLLAEDARSAALDDIQHDAARLHQIIENLLILARLERGREIELEPVLLPRVVKKLVDEHCARYPERELQVTGDGRVPPVLASEVYLEQVIRNLLSNAEKYSPGGRPIEVRLTNEGDAVYADVIDHGQGVPEADRQRIFEAFYRSESAHTVAGVGIGLAVCKRLVEAQDGEITYVPQADGGSCFHITLRTDDEATTGPV